MYTEVDVHGYVQDLEKHLQLTLFSGRIASTPIGAPPSTATETSRPPSLTGLAAAIARVRIRFRWRGSALG
jgi:hypothetical protein